MADTLDVSVVIPVYCNQGSLTKIYRCLRQDVIDKWPDMSYEIIFVDDGSTDDSLAELKTIKEQDSKHIRIVKFSRNFGQVAAILAGYRTAKGKCVVNISADLQDPPALINEMLTYHFDEKYEIVICERQSRDDSFFDRKTSNVFYKIMKKLCFPRMPRGGFDFVLLGKRVKDIILQNVEANPFWQGQILWTGFEIKFIQYKRRKRETGKSKWTFSRKIKYLLDGILGYSYFPLRLMSMSGMFIAFIGFVYAAVIFFARIFGKVPVKGWAPIMIVILVLFGIQMFMLGVIGEYMWRTLDQVRNRPQYIIEEIYD
jgi:dolichol-phosphate mannosyltransferase